MTWILEDGKAADVGEDARPAKKATWIPDEEMPVVPHHEGDAWVPNWLAQQLLRCDTEEEALAMQMERMLREVRARRKHLIYCYQDRAETQAKGDLAAENLGKKRKKPKKSIDYPYGRFSWRTTKVTDVVDEQAAIDWAMVNCEEAVKASMKLVKGNIPKEQLPKVPGITVRDNTSFTIKPARPKIA